MGWKINIYEIENQVMSMEKIKVYSTEWCPDCKRSKAFLNEHGIEYEEINIEDNPDAAKKVQEINNGNRSVPTIVFPDGKVLVEPSNEELGKALDIEK